MNRKRRRPSRLLVGLCLPCVASFHPLPQARRVGGDSSIARLPKKQQQQILLHYSATSTETAPSGNLFVKENSQNPAKDKEEELPPWLSQYSQFTPSQVKEQIQWLEYTLMEQGFLVADISQVVSAVDRVAVQDSELAAGTVDFLRVLLTLRQDESGAVFATTPVLLAAVMHYADCVAARRKCIPDVLREALLRPLSPSGSSSSTPAVAPKRREPTVKLPGIEVMESASPVLARTEPPLGLALAPSAKSSEPSSPYEPEVRLICKGAARVKRAECLAHAVLQHEKVTPTQAARLRDLYLVCMEEDWRSLALRVVACLYRLEGLLREQQDDDDFTKKSPLVVQTAREAMRIYAPLAQRLGMHRLKAMIEERAFRLQYRRQYRAVSSLYRETGEAMQSVSSYLQTHVRQILHNDETLVAQLKTLQVVARVKEPYSFWRKVLNQRIKGLLKPSSSPAEGGTGGEYSRRRTLSITHVNDAVALRVILTARKLEPDEPDEVTRAREQMLCYYVQHLIRAQWPETDAKRLKDYIANPKPNGYQSLHHTSQIASRGIKFPFEVQVRSAEMNAQAEFGVSAHWDYKLSGGKGDSLRSAASAMALPVPKLNETLATIWDDVDADEKVTFPLPDDASLSKAAVVGDYVDALVTAQEVMLRNQIYVFVMGNGNEGNGQGELISVPANSSIGDAIVEIEDLIPAKVQVWKNGRLADAQDKLDNGDVMMIAV